MTIALKGMLLIEPEPPRECELCGVTAECRPYGPKGEQICWPCGLKNPEATKRAMEARLDVVFSGTAEVV